MVRFVLSDDPEPTNWSSWLTVPVEGYLEIAEFGPIAVRDVVRCEIEIPDDLGEGTTELLKSHQFFFERSRWVWNSST